MSYGAPPPGPPGGGYGTGGHGSPTGGYGPPPGGFGGPGGPPPTSEPPKNYLVFNIIGLFGCTVLAIIGLVFALQVSSKWQIGDYQGAESAAKTAKIMGIISFVCAILHVLFWVVYIVFIVIILGAAATSPSYY